MCCKLNTRNINTYIIPEAHNKIRKHISIFWLTSISEWGPQHITLAGWAPLHCHTLCSIYWNIDFFTEHTHCQINIPIHTAEQQRHSWGLLHGLAERVFVEGAGTQGQQEGGKYHCPWQAAAGQNRADVWTAQWRREKCVSWNRKAEERFALSVSADKGPKEGKT